MSQAANDVPRPAEETKTEPPTLPSEYYSMVVDSGPIIKHDVRNLMGKARSYVTTPSVLREIRDSKARDHLEHSVLPLLDLQVREPSDRAMQDVIAFAKQTGDYPSLSTVDLQVLALTLDLEREGGKGSTDHIRTTPKRKIGLGSILPMNQGKVAAKNTEEGKTGEEEKQADHIPAEETPKLLSPDDYDEVEESDDDDEEDNDDDNIVKCSNEGVTSNKESTQVNANTNVVTSESESIPAESTETPQAPKSWATLVNPSAASSFSIVFNQDATPALPFSKLSLQEAKSGSDNEGGQFDDASEDDEEEPVAISTTEEELQLDFPSLAAAATVPYEGEDDEIHQEGSGETEQEEKVETNRRQENPHHKTRASVFMTEEEKQQNLKPLSKSGRTYNSFRKYKGLMKPKPPTKKKAEPMEEEKEESEETSANPQENEASDVTKQMASRFLGGIGGGETMLEEDDDGQGWITSSKDIEFMKTEGGGRLDPGKTGGGSNASAAKKTSNGPPISQRTACATTDFAMQNVLLQMNLVLVSTEGMRIRRLKSWVIRCGACFHIHGADEDFSDGTNHHMRRLFCSHCGSDFMQRISASVDGKTGRLKLHFSKRKQGRHHSIRGTKFSLPKPGSGNKYKGNELLLREDQLLSGAWNQKVKINSGRKYQTQKSQSMFGRDIAASVGCNVRSTSSATFGGKGWATSANTSSSAGGFGADDIRVGFGARKNPNAAKGRERRGKKKKSSDRACGMRRY